MSSSVDYSAHEMPIANLIASLQARGITAVGRYLSRDWRGITAAELQALTAAGIDVWLICEFGARDILYGYQQGVAYAQYADDFMAEIGLPPSAPVYHCADDDFAPGAEQDAIDDYLRGVGSVTGVERVGFYAGYYPLGRSHDKGLFTYGWQTSAWSQPGGVLIVQEWAHLLQNVYNDWVGGTNCDDNDGMQENYGQISRFTSGPIIVPSYPDPLKSDDFDLQMAKAVPEVIIWSYNGKNVHLQPTRRNVALLPDRNCNQYVEPNTGSAHAGPMLTGGQRLAVERQGTFEETLPSGKTKKRDWFETRTGTWIPADATDPRIEFSRRARGQKAA